MRRDQQIGAEQRADAHVLDEVVVQQIRIAARTPHGVSNTVNLVAARDARVLEGVELAVTMDPAVRQRDDVGVVEAAILVLLDQPGADGEPQAVRETDKV